MVTKKYTNGLYEASYKGFSIVANTRKEAMTTLYRFLGVLK